MPNGKQPMCANNPITSTCQTFLHGGIGLMIQLSESKATQGTLVRYKHQKYIFQWNLLNCWLVMGEGVRMKGSDWHCAGCRKRFMWVSVYLCLCCVLICLFACMYFFLYMSVFVCVLSYICECMHTTANTNNYNDNDSRNDNDYDKNKTKIIIINIEWGWYNNDNKETTNIMINEVGQIYATFLNV